MRQRLVITGVLCLAVLAVAAPVSADDPPGVPVCALLDPAKHPRVARLEAALLADPAATWVERNAVEQVLTEQKVQALFGPRGAGDRVRLGKLLKADLLVMVRPVKGVSEAALEVVVSETAGGLRLLVRGVPPAYPDEGPTVPGGPGSPTLNDSYTINYGFDQYVQVYSEDTKRGWGLSGRPRNDRNRSPRCGKRWMTRTRR